jgi:predicted lipid-binding transport protein (Tim44 family)
MLFGSGFFGGMGGFASLLGLVIQIALVVIVARMLFAWWQRRNAPAYATAAGPAPAAGPQAFGGLGSMFGGNKPAGEALTIDKSDYDAFEQLLADVQTAFSAEDIAALRAKASPEMVSYFAEQLAENASRGQVNRITGVKLINGDLSEAWRENGADYATVAMNFALTDSIVDRASGRTVSGGEPGDATELWTFARARGGNWILSAIQQTH